MPKITESPTKAIYSSEKAQPGISRKFKKARFVMDENTTNFLMYTGSDGKVNVEVYIQDETVWLTQKTMGKLFNVESNTITYHLKEIFRAGELNEKATTRKIRAVQKEGSRDVTRELDFYNLDAIIAVGYRVNSWQATQFRIWATGILKEYIIKGFAMDDERLKQGKTLFGKDYFDEEKKVTND